MMGKLLGPPYLSPLNHLVNGVTTRGWALFGWTREPLYILERHA